MESPNSDNLGSKIGANSSTASGLIPVNASTEFSQAYQILYQASPYIKVAHFVASPAMLEAFEAEERVHIIDLNICYGYQWPPFIQALASRSGGPPLILHITAIGFPLESIKETGKCLAEVAKRAQVPFEFHPVEARLQDLTPQILHWQVGEALAVNLISWPRHDVGNSLGNLLTMIRDEAPKIVLLTEREASPDEPSCLGVFPWALRYFSVIFESLDAMFPSDWPERAKVEQHIFAPEIRKLVLSEQQERMGRCEELNERMKIMEEKGFRNMPLSGSVVAQAQAQAQALLSLYRCSGYKLKGERGCLLLGWGGTNITATSSAWHCQVVVSRMNHHFSIQ